MDYVENKSRDKLLKAIQNIQALINDDVEYSYLGNIEYDAYYRNNIDTEELVKLVEELWKVYKSAPSYYYQKGE